MAIWGGVYVWGGGIGYACPLPWLMAIWSTCGTSNNQPAQPIWCVRARARVRVRVRVRIRGRVRVRIRI